MEHKSNTTKEKEDEEEEERGKKDRITQLVVNNVSHYSNFSNKNWNPLNDTSTLMENKIFWYTNKWRQISCWYIVVSGNSFFLADNHHQWKMKKHHHLGWSFPGFVFA